MTVRTDTAADETEGTERRGQEELEEEIESGRSGTAFGYLKSWLTRGRVQQTRNLQSFSDVVSAREVTALIHYVAERGIDPDAEIIAPLNEALAKYRQAETVEDQISLTNEVLAGYSQLCRITYSEHSVNGRTLRDSALSAWYMKSVILCGLAFIVCVLAIHFVEYRSQNFVDGSDLENWKVLLVFLGRSDSVHIVPLFYGGLGACIYLLRTLSKRAASGTFDARRLHGIGARIFLGAIFGFVVVNLLFDAGESSGPILATLRLDDLEQNAVAFFCGLGVKAIYGVFQKIVDLVYDRVSRLGA